MPIDAIKGLSRSTVMVPPLRTLAFIAANRSALGFSSQLGQRKEPTALTATEDDGKDRTHVEG